MRTLATFKWAIAATVAALLAAVVYGGARAATTVSVLIALEASVSFDNAVVNARVLRGLSERWQRFFVTWGILSAVFLMRVLFPVLIVAISTRLSVTNVVGQALHDSDAYARSVEQAAPIIGGFGGTFLLAVAFGFFIDDNKRVHWLVPLEKPLAKAGRLHGLPLSLAAVAPLVVSQLVDDAAEQVLLWGVIGLVAYIVVRGASDLASPRGGQGKASGAAGLAGVLYLELLDASFSLDGVLGAFAVSKDFVVIALGLGAGAIYVRSLTLYLVRRQATRELRYLSCGAYWAIAALGTMLLASIVHDLPEWLPGTLGLGLVAAALVSSVVHNRRERSHQDEGSQHASA